MKRISRAAQVTTKHSDLIRLDNYEARIVAVQHDIDDRIQKLDARLETLLEKHEKDFLTAYRVWIATISDSSIVPHVESVKGVSEPEAKGE